MSNKFDKDVYYVTGESTEVAKENYGDLCREFADETTTPRGVAPRFHLRGNELWTWGPQGNFPHLVETYDTEEEAEFALLETFEHDLLTNEDPGVYIFDTEAEALEFFLGSITTRPGSAPALEDERMSTIDFKKGDPVLYVPPHANDDINHPDCERGVVSSANDHYVFVKYDNLECIMVTGDEPYTAQATPPDYLVRR